MSVTKKEILMEKLEICHMSSAGEKHKYSDIFNISKKYLSNFASCCADGKVAVLLRGD